MARADFYLIGKPRFRDEPLLLVCELAKKAFEGGHPLLVLARDGAQAEALDDLLWSFEPDAFIPHQIFDGEEAFEQEDVPVLIVTPEMAAPSRSMVLNLRDDVAPGPFDRVLEVVPADPSLRAPLRERWKAYQARGYTLNSHDM